MPRYDKQWRERQRASQLGVSRNRGTSNPFFGKHHTEAQKTKWSEQKKGKSVLPSCLTKEELYNLYIEKEMPVLEISKTLEVSRDYVRKALVVFGIPQRTSREVRELIKRQQKGRQKSKTLVRGDYVLVLQPEHPRADRLGYVREHILVLEKKLGRPLFPGEIGHHLNGIKSDNRPSNLVAMPSKKHALFIPLLQKRIQELEGRLKGQGVLC